MDDLPRTTTSLDMTDVSCPPTIGLEQDLHALSMLLHLPLARSAAMTIWNITRSHFGNGIGKQSLQWIFISIRRHVTKMTFFQSYWNWLTIINMIACQSSGQMYEHIPECSVMNEFSSSFASWHNMVSSYAPVHQPSLHFWPRQFQLTYICWNVHTWTNFLPNVLNL